MINGSLERDRSRQKKPQRGNIIKVYNFPKHCNQQDVAYHLFKTLQRAKGLIKPGTPVLDSQLHQEGQRYLKIQLRSVQETINCLQLNGLVMGRKVLLIRSDYPIAAPETIRRQKINTDNLQLVSFKVQNNFDTLYIANMPPKMTEFQMIDFLSEYGVLKAFETIPKVKGAGASCFCQFRKQQQAEQCLSKLSSLLYEGRTLIAKRAHLMKQRNETSIKKATVTVSNEKQLNMHDGPKESAKGSSFSSDMESFYMTFDTVGFFKNLKISCVLLLKNIAPRNVSEEITVRDLRRQLEKVGPIVRMEIKGSNVYVEYQRVEYAQIAYLVLMYRKYDQKIIEVNFYDPLKFAEDIFIL